MRCLVLQPYFGESARSFAQQAGIGWRFEPVFPVVTICNERSGERLSPGTVVVLGAITTLLSGGKLVLMDRFRARLVWDLIEREKVI